MGHKLNIGAGEHVLPGYVNLDRKTGDEAFPLAVADGSCSEIRASHLLEHFPHNQIAAVLADWVRALEPGGMLKVAVPDFRAIAEAYLAGQALPIQAFIMGGQVDGDDFHHTIFDEECLADALRTAGLIGISHWCDPASDDCSAYDISLNLQGIKPGGKKLGKIVAVMSVPRLGFQDNMFSAMRVFPKFGIELVKTTGAFWGQCLTRAMNEAIASGAEWIMTLDYDSVFNEEHVELLLSAASRWPDADAICPIQSHRSEPTPLMTLKGADGKPMQTVAADTFAPELTQVSTAHFGLTMIRVSSLQKLPKPWFIGTPGVDGEWGDDRIDDDIHFWRLFEQQGMKLYQANRVAIGHMELMVRWPGRDFVAIHQHPSSFFKDGPPEEVWR